MLKCLVLLKAKSLRLHNVFTDVKYECCFHVFQLKPRVGRMSRLHMQCTVVSDFMVCSGVSVYNSQFRRGRGGGALCPK